MTSKGKFVRMGEATERKLNALVEQYGSITQVVAVAIDRLYQAEREATEDKADGTPEH